jgi:hypothetical protein
LNAVKSDCGCFAQRPVERSQDLRSHTIRHKALASLSKDEAQPLTNLDENRALYSPPGSHYRTIGHGYGQ